MICENANLFESLVYLRDVTVAVDARSRRGGGEIIAIYCLYQRVRLREITLQA